MIIITIITRHMYRSINLRTLLLLLSVEIISFQRASRQYTLHSRGFAEFSATPNLMDASFYCRIVWSWDANSLITD